MMPVPPSISSRGQEPNDPRTQPDAASERDMRPVVERPARGLSGAAVTVIAAVAGLALFGALEARRQNATAPAATPRRGDASGSAAPPPLYVPPPSLPQDNPPPSVDVPAAPSAPSAAQPVASLPMTPPVSPPANDGSATAPVTASAPPRQTPRTVSGQALVLDNSGSLPAASDEQPEANGKTAGAGSIGLATTRARSATFANRSTTVPQGTLIPAVLETAFDSTSPGFARALVQKDIHGFDGTRVLVPRGSRLIGEYGAETKQGQRRAVILWSRLIRPDGVTIAIGSPAADPVGRGGVKADVNTHFLERFSGAILQSALDLGVTLAARNSRSPVIVALPGTGSRVASVATTQPADITPTLRVPAGRSVSVFVARDLDFTGTDNVR